jgi:hypothetical protein
MPPGFAAKNARNPRISRTWDVCSRSENTREDASCHQMPENPHTPTTSMRQSLPNHQETGRMTDDNILGIDSRWSHCLAASGFLSAARPATAG